MTQSATATDEVRRAFAAGTTLDLAGADVPATLLAGLLAGTAPPTEGRIPALRLTGAVVRGPLQLPGGAVTALVELTGCTFDQEIDLYAAELAGWRMTRCELPGLRAANVRVRSELALENCTVTGPVVLPDARIEGPLRLIGTRLDAPGGHALVGVRLVVRGVLDARRLQVEGEVRLSGARVDGNIDFRGAHLSRPGGDALEASGVQVGGNLRCDRGLRSQGRVVLAGASVAGNAVFSGATLQGTTNPDDPAVLVLPRGRADPSAALVADRLRVNGNLVLDAGFTATGTIRLTSARVGGYLRLSGATLGGPVEPVPDNGDQPRPVPVALAADGIEVFGDLEARGSVPRAAQSEGSGPLRAHGQVRLVGAQVHGSVSLTGVALLGPGLDVLFADRLRVGGALFLRGVTVSGSIRLHHAHIGSTLDCTGARLEAPRCRPDGSTKASLDARAATIGKDLFASRGFTAAGGVRLSLVDVSKSVNFTGARLGGPGKGVSALRARGMTCQELRLRFAQPPGAAGQAATLAHRARASRSDLGLAAGVDRRLRLPAVASDVLARGVLAARVAVVFLPSAAPARHRPGPLVAAGDLRRGPAGPGSQLGPGRAVADLWLLRLGGQLVDCGRLATAVHRSRGSHPHPHPPLISRRTHLTTRSIARHASLSCTAGLIRARRRVLDRRPGHPDRRWGAHPGPR
ncbi:MAG: hypothetical protein ACRDS0_02625 [Pseudonocardiaceae bacterium]